MDQFRIVKSVLLIRADWDAILHLVPITIIVIIIIIITIVIFIIVIIIIIVSLAMMRLVRADWDVGGRRAPACSGRYP